MAVGVVGEHTGAETGKRRPYRGDMAYWAVAGLGVFLLTSVFVQWNLRLVDTGAAVIIGIPVACLLGLTAWIHQGPLSETYYHHVFRWTFLGALLPGVFIFTSVVLRGSSLAGALDITVFVAGFGGAAGVLVGLNRGQSEQTKAYAERLEHQHDHIEFLNAMLRHNILNKLAVIKGNAELTVENDDVDAEHIDTVISQTDDIEELVENVRVLLRSFTGESELRPIDVSQELEKEVSSLERAYPEARIDVDVPDGLTVIADTLVRYSFENLLHNAVEHNDSETPRVRVLAERSDDTVAVRIADNGPGIPDRIRDNLLVDDPKANHGVGLYLVDTLLSSYGGSVRIDDNDPRGTVVTLTFQRSKPVGDDADSSSVRSSKAGEEVSA